MSDDFADEVRQQLSQKLKSTSQKNTEHDGFMDSFDCSDAEEETYAQLEGAGAAATAGLETAVDAAGSNMCASEIDADEELEQSNIAVAEDKHSKTADAEDEQHWSLPLMRIDSSTKAKDKMFVYFVIQDRVALNDALELFQVIMSFLEISCTS